MATEHGPEDHCTVLRDAQDWSIGKQMKRASVLYGMAGINRRNFVKLGGLSLLLTACGQQFTQARSVQEFPPGLFDPTDMGDEPLPDNYFRSFGRDQLAPVYDPTFVTASEVPWPDDEIVIGVNINGTQRAYPVGFLSNREIVNDQIDDIPLLVTW